MTLVAIKIKQKLKRQLRSFAFYVKSRPKLFRLAITVLHVFPKLDTKLRTMLSNDLVESPFYAVDIIAKVENNERLKYLSIIKQEIETVKQRKL